MLVLKFTTAAKEGDASEEVTHTYSKQVDWTNATSVDKLNKWRQHLYTENHKASLKGKPSWCEREKETVLRIAAELLTTRSNIPWKRLANKFNAEGYLAGVHHSAGERCMAQRPLTANRRAPWRSSTAIAKKAQLWPDFKDMADHAFTVTNPLQDTYSDDEEFDEPEEQRTPTKANPNLANATGGGKRKEGEMDREDYDGFESVKKARFE